MIANEVGIFLKSSEQSSAIPGYVSGVNALTPSQKFCLGEIIEENSSEFNAFLS